MAGCKICNSLHETNGKYENLNSIKSQLHYHQVTYYSWSYVVNLIHDHFMETDLHLQISQHQASLKHENFSLSYHSNATLLPQNILQLQMHFSCTLYSINNLRFTNIRVSWNGELPLHVPNYKIFLTHPNLNDVGSVGPMLIWAVVICSNIYNICKSEWHTSNLTRWF